VLLASSSLLDIFLFFASFFLAFLHLFQPFALTTPSASTMAEANWAVDLPSEVWALVAAHRGIVGACQMMRVCKDARAGGIEYLRTLPGLVVCGGKTEGEEVSDVLRLDLATMQWEPMPALVTARSRHACCAVRGTLVALGRRTAEDDVTSSVEMLSSSDSEEEGAFVDLPPLSCGGGGTTPSPSTIVEGGSHTDDDEYEWDDDEDEDDEDDDDFAVMAGGVSGVGVGMCGAAAFAVDASNSAAGQVLLLGGFNGNFLSTVQLVDLATGACVPQNNLLHPRAYPAAGRLPDGRVVCAGGISLGDESSSEVLGPPDQGAVEASLTWRMLPAMSAGRWGCCGCVMSDARFAVLGGASNGGVTTSSCEALVVDDGDAHWEPLPPMHDERYNFACGVVAGCPIVAGGHGL
jgi:hypothetical protein